MLKKLRIIIFSIIVSLIGLYVPVLVIAIMAGETNYESVLPYCIISSIVFLSVYLWIEIKHNK